MANHERTRSAAKLVFLGVGRNTLIFHRSDCWFLFPHEWPATFINVVRIPRRRNEVLLGYLCLSTLLPSASDKVCCPVLVNSV